MQKKMCNQKRHASYSFALYKSKHLKRINETKIKTSEYLTNRARTFTIKIECKNSQSDFIRLYQEKSINHKNQPTKWQRLTNN